MDYLAIKFLLISFFAMSTARTDLTQEAETIGRDVVFVTTSLIQQSGIFPDDNRLLTRVAYVESQYGLAPDTFREGYHGGIWQVDQQIFLVTQDVTSHPELIASGGIYEGIAEAFNINWPAISWLDLRKPLVSALAARIYFELDAVDIPPAGKVNDQGEFWKNTSYNVNDEDTVSGYALMANSLEMQGKMVLTSCAMSAVVQKVS